MVVDTKFLREIEQEGCPIIEFWVVNVGELDWGLRSLLDVLLVLPAVTQVLTTWLNGDVVHPGQAQGTLLKSSIRNWVNIPAPKARLRNDLSFRVFHVP